MKKSPPEKRKRILKHDNKQKSLVKASIKKGPRILFYDLETAPNLGFVWAKYEQDVLEYKREWYILSIAYKWQGGRTRVLALPDFPEYKKNKENDIRLVRALWKLFDEADITVAHNNFKFDRKKSNTRFVQCGLNPPSPTKDVDTLHVARKYFKFNSNKLDDLAWSLKLGRKMETGGYALWRDCMIGKKLAWNKMKRYNKMDVVLLEKVYNYFLPWMTGYTPNTKADVCPKCGSSKIQYRGWHVAATGIRYRRYACQSCGGWSRARKGEKMDTGRSSVSM